jgi:hypothetical protein
MRLALSLPATGVLAFGCSAPAPPPVSFHSDIVPILNQHCISCHIEGKPGTEASGLQLDSYAHLMKGTRFGAVVVPGDPLSSVINTLVEGRADPRIKMPLTSRDQLTAAEIAQLHDWVQQGARDN